MKYIIFLYVLTVGMFTYCTIDLENEVENLQSEKNSLEFALDFQKEQCYLTVQDLQLQIDSLEKKIELFDFKVDFNFLDVLDAIIEVESNGNDSAYRASEDAVGCLQIRQTMVDDVNRILTKKDKTIRYSYEDRWNREKSIEMFTIVCDYYNWNTVEQMSRNWNGGPRGINKPSTLPYLEKVEEVLACN